ncbi:MAG: hypothetical protein GDA56_31895 [Hormoscilla sp. GM7CHS1pb]|nr:hypothetical protein [Hormoscilla sp. GM7CHS1pb]
MGQTKLQGFLVGPVMKKTSDRAVPKLTNQLLGKKLKGYNSDRRYSFPGSVALPGNPQ